MSGASPLLIKPDPAHAPAPPQGATWLITLGTCVVVVAALSLAREVLLPITLAVLLSFVLAPLVDLLRRIRLGRVPSVLLAALLSLFVILSISGIIGTQLASLMGDIPRYAGTIESKIQSLQGVMAGRVSGLVAGLARRVEAPPAPVPLVPPPPSVDPGSAMSAPAPVAPSAPPPMAPIAVEVHQPPASPTELAQRVLAPLLSPLATTGIVFVVAIFILLQRQDLRDRLIRLLGTRDLHRTMMALDDAGHRLSRYFITQLALNAAFGVLIGLGLMAIGVPSPVLWGIVAGLLRFVPYIGAVFSAALPMALAAAVDPGWSMVAWTAALFAVAEAVMGHAVEPVVYGHSTGLSPISVVVAAIFWGWLWGPIGLILSMPLTLCLVVLGRHVGRLEFLDVLFGDQPALTRAQSFYQGMLAGNVDEVQSAAEQMLKEQPLSAYYDEVALPGLQLAAIDIDRGVLSEVKIARIGTGFVELLAELADHDDPAPSAAHDDPAPAAAHDDPAPAAADDDPTPAAAAETPAPWAAASAILCVAGRGPLDAAAAAMLAQLLGRHGMGAREVPYADVGSRAALATLETGNVRMVCLCHASIAGTPTNLRYTVRRLRARLPGVTILVSLPPRELAEDDRLRVAIGADRYADTLAGAVAACQEQAAGGPA